MFNLSRSTKWSFFYLLLTAITSTIVAYTPIKSFVGTIQYPNIKNLPQMPAISYEGQQIIITECDETNNKICYEVPLSRKHQKDIYFLFTENENITITLKDHDELAINNTVDHLSIKKDASYRIFKTTINHKYDFKTKKTMVSWTIKEMALPENGHIPDSTLIFPIPSNYVKELIDGDTMQLPTIVINDNIHLIAGGEDNIHEIALKEVVASIDLKTLHTRPLKAMKQIGASTLIIPTV